MENNKQNLASSTSITSKYAGKPTKEFFTPALLDSTTVSTKGLTVYNDKNYKVQVRSYDLTGALGTGKTCTFTPTSNVTYSEKELAMQYHWLNETECIDDYAVMDWTDEQLNSQDIPAEFETALLDKQKKFIRNGFETRIWKGNLTGGTGYVAALYDGFIRQIKTGSPIVQTGTTITASNVIAELNKVWNKIPDALSTSELLSDLVIFVSPTVAKAYKQAQGVLGFQTPVGDKSLDFNGIELRVCGIGTNQIVAGVRANFQVYTNIDTDFSSINVKNMYPVNFDRQVRFEAHWKENVGVANIPQIVMYG
ncbi:hypothetical protein WSM22_03360 [Cytophagales bacterium WSM2-2]|nr:hypothetical protein WSM22_03360 [Cytophagales bacterium WSM2-2]